MDADFIGQSRRSLSRFAVAVLAASLAVLGLGPVSTATADTAPPPSTPATASADALPTVQVNGVVWKIEVVGRTAYAVGKFTAARPAGAPAGGPDEVPRSNILAFDVETGKLLPFAPVLNAQALVVKASPDGSRIYVGGDFSSVNGVSRSKIAAFNTSTGALQSFRPDMSSRVRALAVTDTTVYAGGDFKTVNGVARTRLAAFSRPHDALLGWVPTADDDVVEALVAAPDDSRVIVGGRFQTLNLQDFVGVGAVDGRTGATLPWSAKVTPAKKKINGVMKRSWVTDLVVQDGTVYGSNNGDGHHWFDGRWAADFATGDLVWLDNCYGATYGVFVRGEVLYSAGHPHDCSSIGAFPETNPQGYYRALAETTYPVGIDTTPPSVNSTIKQQPVPGLLHWFPQINAGTFTGQGQGSWAVDGNARYIVMGGEFTKVNGVAQQGLVRFAVPELAPNDVGPAYADTLLPSALSLAPGAVRVAWPATWDRDNARLTYSVYRDDKTLVYSADHEATAWTPSVVSRPAGPSMGFTDTGLQPGAKHRYKLVVSDPFGNTLDDLRTPEVTVTGTELSGYPAAVLAAGATSYWRLGKGGASLDHAGYDDLVKGAGVSTAPGALADDADPAGRFDGTDTGFAVTEAPVATSGTFSLEAWVKTTSTTGGKIVGYASNTSGSSGVYDRHLFMDTTGALVFGARTTSGLKTVASPSGFADGAYHHVVGTFSPSAGMMLYVDGKRVASLTGLTAFDAPLGYWRIGGDNLDGWPKKPASRYLAGAIDEVAVYPTAISATTVSQHHGFRFSSGNQAPVAVAVAVVKRLAGDERYATAAKIVQDSFAREPVPVAFIATGAAFADALAAGPAADVLGGPVLPVAVAGIPAPIRAELTRLRPGRIVILGGSGAVSTAIARELDSFTSGTVTRLEGGHRYATAARGATAVFTAPVPQVLVATGASFADALAGGAVGAKTNSPVLLVSKNTLPAETAAALRQLRPRNIAVLGGTGVISDAVATTLRPFAVGGGVTRLAGGDRYATAARLAQVFWPTTTPVVYLATGRNFPDALAGVPAAGRDQAPLLLVEQTCMPAATKRELERLRPTTIVVLGGTATVSAAAASGAVCAPAPTPRRR